MKDELATAPFVIRVPTDPQLQIIQFLKFQTPNAFMENIDDKYYNFEI